MLAALIRMQRKGPAVEGVMPYGNYFLTEFHYCQASQAASLLRLR